LNIAEQTFLGLCRTTAHNLALTAASVASKQSE
jgi:hypothetical protein